MTMRDWFFPPEIPHAAIYTRRTITHRAECITSRLYVDHWHKVQASRASDHLFLGHPFEWPTRRTTLATEAPLAPTLEAV